MDRFYSETIGDAGARVTLTPEETRHMVAVRRVAVGDEVTLFDGAGTEATARVVSTDGKCAVVEVLAVRRAECDMRCRLTVATALPKGARASGCTPVRVDGPVMRIETACAALTALVLHECS